MNKGQQTNASPNPLVRFTTHDPDEFAEKISRIAPGLRCSALQARTTNIDICAAELPSVGIFRSTMKNFRVQSSNPSFYGITIPLKGDSRFLVDGHAESIHGSKIHLQHTGKEFDGRMGEEVAFESLELCFEQSSIDSMITKIYGKEADKTILQDILDSRQPMTQSFVRHAVFIWSELNRGGAISYSSLIAQESAKILGTLLVSAAGSNPQTDENIHSHHSPVMIRRAEDYVIANLLNPISIADVAAASGMSARSLSRGLRRQHGTTIKGFIKQRRLEAVNRALFTADPGQTNVTCVALEHGFDQLGRFSADYKKAFGELPSATLVR